MKLKRLTVVAGALAFAGYASSATVADSTGDSVTDDGAVLIAVSNGGGTGARATPFAYDATLLGDCACLEVSLTGQDLPASIHTLGAQMSMTLTNDTGVSWKNVELAIQPECGVPSPDTDGLSFDQRNAVGRDILADVPHTVTVDELDYRDFIQFDFDTAVADGDSVTLTFPVASGAGAAPIDPFYLKIAYNIPEPSSVALMGLGFIGLFVRRRR